VTSVGSTTPVADFLALIADTSEDMLVKASTVCHSLLFVLFANVLLATDAAH
jgi:hypothetical protein